MLSSDDRAMLRDLEERLWRMESRFDRDFMDSILAKEFFEVGASGAVHSRQAVLDAEAAHLDVELPLPDFAVRALDDQTALVTYRSVERRPDGSSRTALRSSVWLLTDGSWSLAYHQGTLTR